MATLGSDPEKRATITTSSRSSDSNDDNFLASKPEGDVYDVAATHADPVLAKKIAAVNDAIDIIGLTPYHWKLFCLNGFGYAVDSVSHRLLCLLRYGAPRTTLPS